jgi:hypothetical protein
MHVLTNGCPPRLGEPNIAMVVAVEKQKCTLRFFYRPEQTRHLAKEVRSNAPPSCFSPATAAAAAPPPTPPTPPPWSFNAHALPKPPIDIPAHQMFFARVAFAPFACSCAVVLPARAAAELQVCASVSPGRRGEALLCAARGGLHVVQPRLAVVCRVRRVFLRPTLHPRVDHHHCDKEMEADCRRCTGSQAHATRSAEETCCAPRRSGSRGQRSNSRGCDDGVCRR